MKFPQGSPPGRNQNAELEEVKAESEKGLQEILQSLSFRKENEKHKFEIIS